MNHKLSNRRSSYHNDFTLSPQALYEDELFHRMPRIHDEGIEVSSEVKCDKKKFLVNLDMQNFQPGDINVQMKGKFVVIEGNHEVLKDGLGVTNQHFEHCYLLPENAMPKELHYNFSSDGILHVEVCRDTSKEELMGAELWT